MIHWPFRTTRSLATTNQAAAKSARLAQGPIEHSVSTAAPAPGQVLGGRYRLKDVLGKGGTSTVYRALDLELQRAVAIKVISVGNTKSGDGTPGSGNGLRAEALTALRLSHPLIVRVHDYAQQPPWEYLVMEMVSGNSLHVLLQSRQGRRLRPEETILIGLDVLEALGFAHEKQIIHNDVTPKNILMDDNGGVKVCDFGASERLEHNADRPIDSVAGTILFTSPERMSGLPTDARSDIYSLGATLYTACSGRAPFDLNTISLRKKDSLQPRTVREKVPRSPHLPPLFHAVLEKALEIDPTRRFADAHEMRSALVRLLAKTRCTQRGDIPDKLGFGIQDPQRLTTEPCHNVEDEAWSHLLHSKATAVDATAVRLNPTLLLQRVQRRFDKEASNQAFPHRLDTVGDNLEKVAIVNPADHDDLIERCDKLLETTLNASPNIEGIALVSQSKLIMWALSADMSERRVMEIGGILMNLEATLASKSAETNLKEVTMRWDRGYAIAITIKTGTRLLVLSNDKAKLGILLYNLRSTVDEIKRIVDVFRSRLLG